MVALLDSVCLALQDRNLPAAALALDEFSGVLTRHFASEEGFLAQIFAIDADQHRQSHRDTADLVGRLRVAIGGAGDLPLAERLVAELVTEWIRRLFREDNDLVTQLKGTGGPGLGPAE